MTYSKKMWRIKLCQILEYNNILVYTLSEDSENPGYMAWANISIGNITCLFINVIIQIDETTYEIPELTFIYKYENNISKLKSYQATGYNPSLKNKHKIIMKNLLYQCLDDICNEYLLTTKNILE